MGVEATCEEEVEVFRAKLSQTPEEAAAAAAAAAAARGSIHKYQLAKGKGKGGKKNFR